MNAAGPARLRLLMLAPTALQYVGGTETVVAELARRLAPRTELTIVAGRTSAVPAGPLRDAADAGAALVSVPFDGRDTPANRRRVRWLRMNPFRVESRSFFRALASHHIDPGDWQAVLTFYEMDATLLATRHPALRGRALHLLPGVGHRRFFRRVDVSDVLFVGTRGSARARRKWALEIDALPLGVDARFFAAAPRAAPGSRRLVFVGRLDGSKRVDWLADTFAASDLAARGYTLELVGDGPLGDALARRHGSTPGVVLHGRRTPDEVAALLRDARLLLHPTELESFGLTLLEAMAAGVPVITHALEPIRAWAGDHPVYAAHLDAAAWHAAIVGFEDDARWARVSARNLAFARGFDWDTIAARVLERLLHRAAA